MAEGGKVAKRGGRPARALELQALDAVNRSMPPEKIEEIIGKTWQWCQDHKSVNGSIKLLELLLNYQLGQPVKRVVSTRAKVEDLLESMMQYDDDAFDNVIDAMYTRGKE